MAVQQRQMSKTTLRQISPTTSIIADIADSDLALLRIYFPVLTLMQSMIVREVQESSRTFSALDRAVYNLVANRVWVRPL